MSVHHSLFCCFFLSLHITDTRTGDPVKRFYGVPGENMEISVYFASSGQWKIFCRENCAEVLVETDGVRAERGKYSIRYEGGVLYVSISALTWSDSGRYQCGLKTSSSSYSYRYFDLVVAEALLDGSKVPDLHKVAGSSLTVACYFGSSGRKWLFCRGGCGKDEVLVETDRVTADRGRYRIEYEDSRSSGVVYVTIAQLTWPDSGRYQCGLKTSSSRYSYRYFDLVVAEALLNGSKVPDLHKEAGSSLTVTCYFGSSGRKQQFCRGECGKDEVLVETDGVGAERGRYNIKYEEGVLYVSISALTRSDSGRYRCKLDVVYGLDKYRDFHLTVTDAVDPSASSPTSPQRFRSSSAGLETLTYFHTSTSSVDNSASQLPSSLYVPLIVGVTLVLVLVLVSAALLVSCRRRCLRDSRRRRDDGVRMEDINYENVSSQVSTYQSLSPASRDQNQIYSTLSQPT